MATIRSSGGIRSLGSGKAWYYECDSSGTPTGALQKLPLIIDSTLNDETAVTEVQDEGGNTYTSDGTRKVTLSLTAMQRDAESINLAVQTLRGKYVTILKELAEDTVNGKYQMLVAAIAKPTAKLNFKLPDGKVAYEFTLQNNLSTISVNLATTNSDTDASTTWTGTASVGQGNFWK